MKRHFRELSVAAALVVYGAINLQWTYDAVKPEFRTLGQSIRDMARDQDLVLYRAPLIGDWFSSMMYLAVERYAPDLRAPCVIMTRPLSGYTRYVVSASVTSSVASSTVPWVSTTTTVSSSTGNRSRNRT